MPRARGAFLDALEKAKPVLLEPIVNIEITIPAENMGDITGDLASRRGRVSGQDMLPGGMMVIKAQVPLSEVSNYNSQLKSVTGGQGSYSMELSHYEPTAPNVQMQVIEQYKKEKAAGTRIIAPLYKAIPKPGLQSSPGFFISRQKT